MCVKGRELSIILYQIKNSCCRTGYLIGNEVHFCSVSKAMVTVSSHVKQCSEKLHCSERNSAL